MPPGAAVSKREETQAEAQLRLHHEQECRRIAEIVKRELPESRAFFLVTCTRGGGPHADFQSLDYVSTIDPDDALRLLQELLHLLTERTGATGQPTWFVATMLREHVHAILEGLEGEPPPSPEKVWDAFCRARKGQGSVSERSATFMSMATVGLIELEWLERKERKREQG